MDKHGQPLSLEKKHYTGHNTAERAERVVAAPTPAEEQRIVDFLKEQGLDDLETFAKDCQLPPDDQSVMRSVALMCVRGALGESCRDWVFRLMLATDDGWLEILVPTPEERMMVEALCEQMDLPAQDPMCRSMAIACWLHIFNDEEWELVAHLLRKVKVSTSEITPRH